MLYSVFCAARFLQIKKNQLRLAMNWFFHIIIRMNICSFVNLAEVVACKPEFVRALEARKSNREVGDK